MRTSVVRGGVLNARPRLGAFTVHPVASQLSCDDHHCRYHCGIQPRDHRSTMLFGVGYTARRGECKRGCEGRDRGGLKGQSRDGGLGIRERVGAGEEVNDATGRDSDGQAAAGRALSGAARRALCSFCGSTCQNWFCSFLQADASPVHVGPVPVGWPAGGTPAVTGTVSGAVLGLASAVRPGSDPWAAGPRAGYESSTCLSSSTHWRRQRAHF